MVVAVVLGFPHLVLAYVGGDDGFALGDAPEVVHDVCGVEVAVVGQVADVADGGGAFAGFDGVEPGGAVAAGEQRQELFEDFAKIADEGYVGLDVLVDFGGVNVDVDLFRIG